MISCLWYAHVYCTFIWYVGSMFYILLTPTFTVLNTVPYRMLPISETKETKGKKPPKKFASRIKYFFIFFMFLFWGHAQGLLLFLCSEISPDGILLMGYPGSNLHKPHARQEIYKLHYLFSSRNQVPSIAAQMWYISFSLMFIVIWPSTADSTV